MKFNCIKTLIDRNKIKKPIKHIKFPFLIIEPSGEQGTDLFIKMQSDLSKTLLTSNKNLRIYGDLEIINEIPSVFSDQRRVNDMPEFTR